MKFLLPLTALLSFMILLFAVAEGQMNGMGMGMGGRPVMTRGKRQWVPRVPEIPRIPTPF